MSGCSMGKRPGREYRVGQFAQAILDMVKRSLVIHMWRWIPYFLVWIWLLPLGGMGHAAEGGQPDSLCPEPALSRLIRHRIRSGETLVSIAQRYNLIPATLMGFNPVLREGNAPVGREILIPPYNGVQAEVPGGSSWQDIAAAYGVRADVLFEVNGCRPVSRVVFVPGVNWSPISTSASAPRPNSVLSGYPLPEVVPVMTGYGWQVDPNSERVVFNSGVDLAAPEGTPVLSVGDGIVAFASNQGNYGNLVVINHENGLQTRYSQLATITVQLGRPVRRGDRIGTVGTTGRVSSPRLHFEVRLNSDLGWVAQDPGNYLENMQVGD